MGVLSIWSNRARIALTGQGGEPGPGEGGEPPEPMRESHARLRWAELCRCDEFRGRWVALDGCRYDEATGQAAEGSVVDVDDDLVELCARIRASERKNCAILFCGEPSEEPARG
jgi:hypothetical protein